MPRQTLKKRPDGRYVCTYHGKFFYGYTQAEALAARDAYKRDDEAGLHSDKRNTVGGYASYWLPIYRAQASTAAYRQYAGMLNAFTEFLGASTPLGKITKSDVAAYYATLAEMSKSYIDKAKSLIRSMLSDAVSDGLIRSNPALTAKPPSGTEGTHRRLEDWEIALVHQMVGHRFGVAAMLMLYAGLRRGEVLAFDIDRDADFERGRIYVREAVSFSEGCRGKKKDPKTEAGVREIPLFNPLREVLQGRHGLAAASVSGKQMTLSAFDRAWESYLSKMGDLHNGFSRRWANGRTWVPMNIRTNDFRHTFCSMCCDAYVPIEVLMLWMGHSDEKMIRRIYDHITNKRKSEAIQKAAEKVEIQAQLVKSIVNPSESGLNPL